MSIFVPSSRVAPRRAEARDISTYPWMNGQTVPTNLQSPTGGAHMVSSDAFRVAAVVACLGLRAGALAQLPLKGYASTFGGESEALSPQPELLLFDPPSVVASVWKTQMSISRDIWGYAAGIIKASDAAGYATRVEWILPDRLTAKETDSSGQLVWRYNNVPIDPQMVMHIPSRWVMPGRPLGVSPLEKSGLIDIAIRAQEFGRDWFVNGAMPSAIVYSDDVLTTSQADGILARLQSRWRRRQPGMLGSGMRYEQVSVNADESQFLHTMQQTASDIAISFNLPPNKIHAAVSGSDVSYTNNTQSTQQYLMDSINPDLVVIQESVSRYMRAGQMCRWETGAFLRSDTKSRYEAYSIGLSAGFLSVDEVRAKEDLAPLPPSSVSAPVASPVEPTPAPLTPA